MKSTKNDIHITTVQTGEYQFLPAAKSARAIRSILGSG